MLSPTLKIINWYISLYRSMDRPIGVNIFYCIKRNPLRTINAIKANILHQFANLNRVNDKAKAVDRFTVKSC